MKDSEGYRKRLRETERHKERAKVRERKESATKEEKSVRRRER